MIRQIFKTAIVAALMIVCGNALAQTQQAPLPDVHVTAPAPIQHVNPFNPFVGDTRVDESKWPVIPCANARIDFGPGAKCQTGTQIENFMTMSKGRCDIARQLTMVDDARYKVEADVMIFDPYKLTAYGYQMKNCTVWSGYTNMPDDFRDMNQMTRRGTGWRNFVKGAPQSTIEYSDGTKNCLAVERLGPPWHGGYVWVVHASICPAAQAALQLADVDAMFGQLQLRTYDAQGNLRGPGQ